MLPLYSAIPPCYARRAWPGDSLAWSQKVSHPLMRPGSAAKLALRTRCSFSEPWCMLVSVCFHNLDQWTEIA
jgi:hypothetical protein